MSDGLKLTWQLASAGALADVRLERAATVTGPWVAVPAEAQSVGDAITAVDHGVEPARTYWYRLVVTSPKGARAVFGPVTATTAAPAAFELNSAWPNPTRGPMQLVFTVAREAPVRLSLLDLQGREVEVLARGPYQAGRYQVSWDGRTDRGPVPAGLYFVRYRTPDRTLVRRLVITP